MTIESLPEHLRKPHLRPIQPIPVNKDGRQFVALRDPAMLSGQTMVVSPQVMPILQFFRGEQALTEIAQQFKAEIGQFIELARGLDRVGLLWGPTFERLEEQMREKVRSRGAFPPQAAASLGEDEAACRKAIDGYFEQTDDPELEAPPIAIIAPHLDYPRGWPNYAAAYYTVREVERPDRVVILGTNHYGVGDGVIMSEYGFDTPMGRIPVDKTVSRRMVERLGRPLIVDQLDHLAEHSVQLQLPWLQHCFGEVPVVAFLVPDPLVPMIADDGERVALEPFVAALKESLAEAGGRTFYVASSDLSHVGPQFGEPRPVDEQRRMDVERHDRDMMGSYVAGDAEEFLSAFRWNRNPTRWCSIGNMTALLMLSEPKAVELIDYRQACDERGTVLVSSAAMALM